MRYALLVLMVLFGSISVCIAAEKNDGLDDINIKTHNNWFTGEFYAEKHIFFKSVAINKEHAFFVFHTYPKCTYSIGINELKPNKKEGQYIEICIRIDNNDIYKYTATAISNKKDTRILGFKPDVSPALVNEMKKGSTMRIKIIYDDRTENHAEFSLLGFTSAFDYSKNQCFSLQNQKKSIQQYFK